MNRLPCLAAGLVVASLLPAAGPAAPADDHGGSAAVAVTPKPTAPIDIQYRVPGEPRAGETVEVVLTIAAVGVLSNAELSVDARDALTVLEPAAGLPLGTVSATEPAEIVVRVLAHAPGDHYIHVSVSGDLGGRRQTRSIAVPIRLADQSLRKAAGSATGNQLESVRSFRAVETVR